MHVHAYATMYRLPDAAITADAIVGFPGETDEQFEATLDLMRKVKLDQLSTAAYSHADIYANVRIAHVHAQVKFDQLNTAAYSPRPHTPAALWPNQVPGSVKKRVKKHAHTYIHTCIHANAHGLEQVHT